MTPYEFYKKNPKDRIQRVARGANTTFANFQQIAIAGGSVGKVLAAKLCESSDGEMSEIEILYQERFLKNSTNSE